MPKTPKGVSAVELLVTLTIVSVVATTAVPNLGKMVNHAQRRSVSNDLLAFFMSARKESILTGKIITICPLDKDARCASNWNESLAMFYDPHNSRALKDTDQLIRRLPPVSHGTLTSASLTGKYFQYRPDGQIYSGLGNITWCPADNSSSQAIQLIISRGGRIRISSTTASGHTIEC